jgi:hypothetical protein
MMGRLVIGDIWNKMQGPSNRTRWRRSTKLLVFGMFLMLLCHPGLILSSDEIPGPVNDAALHLVQFCAEPKAVLDERAVAVLAEYVVNPKEHTEYFLSKSQGCQGAYYEFDTKIAFSRFLEYSHNALIPTVVTRPSSVRYSLWSSRGDGQKLPSSWKPVSPGGPPLVIRGLQREADTPDLNTGVYHEYDLKRTIILSSYKGRQVLISISKQISTSNVGKKGVILGDDNNWAYYYSGEPGTPKTGLGWVKSYIYDYFSVGVYVEGVNEQTTMKTGHFRWLRAGWTGINFVQPKHILNGLKRFARSSRAILESPRLPAPNQMISVYQWLSNLPAGDLTKRYTALQQALRNSAIQTGKINVSKEDEHISFSNIPKEQMVEELMLEYVKKTIGKPTLLGDHFSWSAPGPMSGLKSTLFPVGKSTTFGDAVFGRAEAGVEPFHKSATEPEDRS